MQQHPVRQIEPLIPVHRRRAHAPPCPRAAAGSGVVSCHGCLPYQEAKIGPRARGAAGRGHHGVRRTRRQGTPRAEGAGGCGDHGVGRASQPAEWVRVAVGRDDGLLEARAAQRAAEGVARGQHQLVEHRLYVYVYAYVCVCMYVCVRCRYVHVHMHVHMYWEECKRRAWRVGGGLYAVLCAAAAMAAASHGCHFGSGHARGARAAQARPLTPGRRPLLFKRAFAPRWRTRAWATRAACPEQGGGGAR